MNVVVCVKQIPDPANPQSLGPDNYLDRSGKLIIDDSDMYGVEMALQLVHAAGGGEVSLVSMAPNGETAGLRTALAMRSCCFSSACSKLSSNCASDLRISRPGWP